MATSAQVKRETTIKVVSISPFGGSAVLAIGNEIVSVQVGDTITLHYTANLESK